MALNEEFIASPLGWLCLAIGAVVGAVAYCWQKFEVFRKGVIGCWEVIKAFGSSLIDAVVNPFKQILKGIGGVGAALVSLVKGDFKEAAAEAKQGFKDIGTGAVNATPFAMTVNTAKNTDFKGAWEKGLQKGTDSWNASQDEKKNNGINSLIPTPQTVIPEPPTAARNYDDLMKDFSKKKGSGKNKTALDLNETIQDYKESSDYTAVSKKLAPVKINLKPQMMMSDKAASSSKIRDGRPAFADNAVKTVDAVRQDYATEKTDFLKDIMQNVRKIAAVATIPLAMNLSGSNATVIERNDTITENIQSTQGAEAGRSVYVDRVCDNIVIHVANVDGKGENEIRSEIYKVLDELIMYTA